MVIIFSVERGNWTEGAVEYGGKVGRVRTVGMVIGSLAVGGHFLSHSFNTIVKCEVGYLFLL